MNNNTESCCNKCNTKNSCPFYEKDAEECIYDFMLPIKEQEKK